MELRPFLLEEWLNEHEPTARFNLAASTGPYWTLESLKALMTEEEKRELLEAPLTYRPGAGAESLRRELAGMYGASADDIQVVSGASEALLALFFHVAEPSANVVIPAPSFPPFLSIPESLGLEVRTFELRHDEGFRIDTDAISSLIDDQTRLVMVNTPHNPTGATISEDELRELDRITRQREVQLVVDEVYHPIYREQSPPSAGEFLDCTVLGDFSKAFSIPGIRVGWILERDPERRRAYWNARGHFSISNSVPGEILAEIAVRNRETIFSRVRQLANKNLAPLDDFFRANEQLEWVPPHGGMTGFPKLRGVSDTRPFCEAAAARGVLLVPGDCMNAPEHFRIGFGACEEGFEEALDILSTVLVGQELHPV